MFGNGFSRFELSSLLLEKTPRCGSNSQTSVASPVDWVSQRRLSIPSSATITLRWVHRYVLRSLSNGVESRTYLRFLLYRLSRDLLKSSTLISSIYGLLVLAKKLSRGCESSLGSSRPTLGFIPMEKQSQLRKSFLPDARLNILDYSLAVTTSLENGKALCKKIGDL